MSAPQPADGPPPRFGWPMRLFLSAILFAMIFRSFSVLLPWNDWRKELGMDRMPRRLPTRAEMARLRADAKPGEPDPVVERCLSSADDVWRFFRPWPGSDERRHIHSWGDAGKYTICWLCTRLEFIENVLGVNEEWPMFSPNVSRAKGAARARLVYADGSTRIVRQLSDPEDLLHYAHWFEEKQLDHEVKVEPDTQREEENLGWCNLLAHRYARNEAGSSVKTIFLFHVYYQLPPPGVDAREFLRKQQGPPPDQVGKDFFRYDVASRKGTFLMDKE
jgi:hypothetical protein